MARYDYGRDLRRRQPYNPWYPGAFWAGAPLYGWGGWPDAGMWAWPPYAPPGPGRYAADFQTPRRRPEESPSYGRGGDSAARRYARSHGYDEGYTIQPRFEGNPRNPRYDRGYRGRR